MVNGVVSTIPPVLLGLLIVVGSLVACSPSPSAEPDAHPAIFEAKPSIHPHYKFTDRAAALLHPDHARTTSLDDDPRLRDLELLDFVLISTVDGALHAVERAGGKQRWVLNEGVQPLVGTSILGANQFWEEVDGKVLVPEEEYIVEPLGGGLFAFVDNTEGQTGAPKLQKLPLTVEQLVELSPFTFPGAPFRVFTGSKSSSLITIDLQTGEQIDSFKAQNPNASHFEAAGAAPTSAECKGTSDDVLDRLEKECRRDIEERPNDMLFVGRTDYHLTIHSQTSPPQTLTYSTYTPNAYDRPLVDHWSRAGNVHGDHAVGGAGPERRTRVELGHDGVAVGFEDQNGMQWVSKLGAAGIAVYDLLLPLHSPKAHPIFIPQPLPHLPSLFPNPAAHLEILAKPPTTYVGSTPIFDDPQPDVEVGSNNTPPHRHTPTFRFPLTYALSSASYPLINFAPPARPGQLTNGSFHLSDALDDTEHLPFLLDPAVPKELIVPPTEFLTKPAASYVIGKWIFITLAGILLALLGFLSGRWRTKRSFGIVEDPKVYRAKAKQLQLGPRPVASQPLAPPAPEAPVPTVLQDSNKQAVAEEDSAGQSTTLRKTNARRRVRGGKKRRGKSEDSDPKDGSGSGSGGELLLSEKLHAKPLPDLPIEDGILVMDKLTVTDTIIGFGSHGTIVYKGTWGVRPVAVKRLLSAFVTLASQEVALLQASDDHQNVIRYFCQERHDNFLYIALDLCPASLADLIETPDRYMELSAALQPKKALAQVTSGLKHLHSLKIVHRDIKPQNVLVQLAGDGSLKMLVSDFGLAKRLEHGQSSFAPTGNYAAGSAGWRAPECLTGEVKLNEGYTNMSSSSSSSANLDDIVPGDGTRQRARLTKAVDLFALGCLYFWVLMGGEHPYGEAYDRESNIVKGEAVNINRLEILGEEGWEARQLIDQLLNEDPKMRPTTSECLQHPFFWTPAKRLAFLCDASDRFEIMELDPPESILITLEEDAEDVVGRDWYKRLDKVFTDNLGKFRKYKGASVRDLLRAMRNKKHHYQDLPLNVQRHLGPLPLGFLQYFTTRYPKLFLHVHHVVRLSRLRFEPMFAAYFEEEHV